MIKLITKISAPHGIIIAEATRTLTMETALQLAKNCFQGFSDDEIIKSLENGRRLTQGCEVPDSNLTVTIIFEQE